MSEGAGSDSYALFRVRAEGRDCAELLPRLRAETVPGWQTVGWHCWGIWQGLLGLPSNELLLMAAAEGDHGLAPLAGYLPTGATATDVLELRATVRPTGVVPVTRDGLYVFRFFAVRPEVCDEIVALSQQAWQTFETSPAYRSEPLGLFRPRRPDPAGDRMLLVTWYDGLGSWERSRLPAAEARAGFRRRHQLTQGTVAYATRLVPPA